MKYVTVLTLAAVFCLPAKAELLIFQTGISGQQLEIETKIVEKKNERGYLVIDADLSNPDSVIINEAYHLHYEIKAGAKIQYTTIISTDSIEMILVDSGKDKKMVIRWFDDPTGTYTVAQGAASVKDIGNLQRYVGNASGCSVWREQDFRTGSGKIKLRVDIKATKLANIQNNTVQDVIEGYSISLEAMGYSAE